jgi:hypothetical protein
MILEFIFLYSKYRNNKLVTVLNVPLDTHVKRIFKDSFGVDTPNMESIYTNKHYIAFQTSLDKYTAGRGRIYFDYFWFIGKMFCAKIKDKNSRGYKLCNYCWLKNCCKNNKWM